MERFTAVTTCWRRAAEPLKLDLPARMAEAEGKPAEAAALLSRAAELCEGVLGYLKSLQAPG